MLQNPLPKKVAEKHKPPSRLAKLGKKIGSAAGKAAMVLTCKTKLVRHAVCSRL